MEDTNCNQHGFVHDELSNILKSTDVINEYLMKRDNVDIIFLDFSEAFDSVSHFRLHM